MNLKVLALLVIGVALFGCASEPPRVRGAIGTLAAIPHFPREEVASYLPAADWMTIMDREYVGYVKMLASIREDGSVSVGRIVDSYPDASRDETARTLARQVVLHAIASEVTLLPIQGEVYVVFFKPERNGSVILLYGRQTIEPNLPRGGGRMVFAGRPIDGIPQATSFRAKYAQIFSTK